MNSRWARRRWRWAALAFCAGALPAFVLQCQEASLDLQRALVQALGFRLTDAIFSGVFGAA